MRGASHPANARICGLEHWRVAEAWIGNKKLAVFGVFLVMHIRFYQKVYLTVPVSATRLENRSSAARQLARVEVLDIEGSIKRSVRKSLRHNLTFYH